MKERNQKPRTEHRADGHPQLPRIYMPAMPPLGLIEAISHWIAARRRRRAVLRMLTLDERMLQDLGLTRERVAAAAKRSRGMEPPTVADRHEPACDSATAFGHADESSESADRPCVAGSRS